jgi:hypothetical protein
LVSKVKILLIIKPKKKKVVPTFGIRDGLFVARIIDYCTPRLIFFQRNANFHAGCPPAAPVLFRGLRDGKRRWEAGAVSF